MTHVALPGLCSHLVVTEAKCLFDQLNKGAHACLGRAM